MDKVFRRHKTTDTTVAKCQKKFSVDKDVPQRLKHIKLIINVATKTELQRFFVENHSAVYFTVIDAFYNVVSDKLKVTPSILKDLEVILTVLENVLLYLPDLIRSKWQFNSFLELFEDLLNEKNSMYFRRIGIRLFLLWYQILGNNATTKCHKMFINLVPGFGVWINQYAGGGGIKSPTQDLEMLSSGDSVDKSQFGFHPRDACTLSLPSSSEQQSMYQDVGQKLLRHFLLSLVCNVSRVNWKESSAEHHLMQFWFLFEQLKRTYLPIIFPCLSPNYSIYALGSNEKNLSKEGCKLPEKYPISSSLLSVYQETVILWLTGYIDVNPKRGKIDLSEQTARLSLSSLDESAGASSMGSSLANDFPAEMSDQERKRSGASQSAESDLAKSGQSTQQAVAKAGLSSKDISSRLKETGIVCSVLYGCRQNINLLHDMLHHAFLLPIQCYPALFAVVNCYQSWLEKKASRPVFLQSISTDESLTDQIPCAMDVLSIPEDGGNEGDDELDFDIPKLKSGANPLPPAVVADHSGLSDSLNGGMYVLSQKTIGELSAKPSAIGEPEELRGCLQNCIRIMLENMSRVFYLTCPPAIKTTHTDASGKASNHTVDYVKQQMELCRRILLFFQAAAVTNELDTDTWLCLLSILLRVMKSTLVGTSPSDRRENSWLSNEKLIHNLFQTMNGALLRASLLTPIGQDPWNQCMSVYSQLTHWPAVITVWKKVMQSLTNVLAKLVYGVDLSTVNKAKRTLNAKPDPAVSRARPKSFHEASSPRPLAEPPSKVTFPPSANLAQSTVAATSVDSALNGVKPVNLGLDKFDSPRQSDLRKPLALETTRPLETCDSAGSPDSTLRSVHSDGGSFGIDTQNVSPQYGTLVPRRSSNLSLHGVPGSPSECIARTRITSVHDPTYGMSDLLPRNSSPSGDRNHRPRSSQDRAFISAVDSRARCHSIPRSVQEGDHKSSGSSPRSPTAYKSSLSPGGVVGRDSLPSPETSPTSQQVLPTNPEKPPRKPFFATATTPDSMSDADTTIRFNPLSTFPAREDTASGTLVKRRGDGSPDDSASSPRCVLAGGPARGWTAVSVVVCWRRFLGILGNINHISNVAILEQVYAYLSDLVGCLLRIQQFQHLEEVSLLSVRPRAKFCPPLEHIAPILFEALKSSSKPEAIKMSAIRTLCDIMIRPPDRLPNWELLTMFYWTLHRFLNSPEERYVNEIVRSCGMRLFASELPGVHILLMDFLKGITGILNNHNPGAEIPRAEAITMVCTLSCYSSHFGSLDCLAPDGETTLNMMTCSDLKPRLMQLLIRVIQDNVSVEARCLALAALAVQCVIELIHIGTGKSKDSSFSNEAIVVLLGMMRFENHCVALVAVEMIFMLAAYAAVLHRVLPTTPKLILSSLAWTLNRLWSTRGTKKLAPIDKRLIMLLILAIVEWSICVPLSAIATSICRPGETSDALLPRVLHVLSLVASCSNSVTNSGPSDPEQTTNFQDPLTSFLSDCHVPLNPDSFASPRSRLDTTSPGLHSSLIPPHSTTSRPSDPSMQSIHSVRLAARVALCHLLNHLNQFPLDEENAQIHTLIQEHHDQAERFSPSHTDGEPELNLATLERNNVQLFVLNGSIILSCIALPNVSAGLSKLDVDTDAPLTVASRLLPVSPFVSSAGSKSQSREPVPFLSDAQYCRLIVRDLSGKYSWDLSCLRDLWSRSVISKFEQTSSSMSTTHPPSPPPRLHPNPPPLSISTLTDSASGRTRKPKAVPNSVDSMDDLMRQLTKSSPECDVSWTPAGQCTEEPDAPPDDPCHAMEALTNAQLASQSQSEEDALNCSDKTAFFLSPSALESPAVDLESSLTSSPSPRHTSQDSAMQLADDARPLDKFMSCRHLINQLGFLSFERRPTIDLLQKSVGLLRDLKHLDKFGARETHKIAVFYIGAGQEDKQAILSNQTSSAEFERFVAGLGWEIDLLTHRGFRGGLERSGRAGNSAPYYATSTVEVMFHVSTRMPSSTQGDLKYKHLGNDEVMIIWSENVRTFSRSVLRTQFGDVLIIISPLPSGLFRVEVRRESNVGFFGPIVHAAVLDADVLPGLVRATAINASRAIKAMKPNYRTHYEERALSLKQLVSRHTIRSCFEDFAQSLILPNIPPTILYFPPFFNMPTIGQVRSSVFNHTSHSSHENFINNPHRTSLLELNHISDSKLERDLPRRTKRRLRTKRHSTLKPSSSKHTALERIASLSRVEAVMYSATYQPRRLRIHRNGNQ